MRQHGERPEPRQVILRTTCDNCGRVEEGEPDGWVHVSYGHSDWGNDSIESGDVKDACSPACLVKVLAVIAEEYEPLHGDPTLWVSVDMFDYAMVKGLGRMS